MKLVFDIETVGDDYDSLDHATQENLIKWIKKEAANEEDYNELLEELKNNLGFSPLTGRIVVIGILDVIQNTGVIYYDTDNPANPPPDITEDNFKFKCVSEKEMLEKFWKGAAQYQEYISFNGRAFDVPFIMIRSAIHHIKPTVDLMAYRFITLPKVSSKNIVHIDLLDQLSFYGAVKRKHNLHLWCRGFGIKSPKADGITGDDVSRLFKEKKFIEIAKYNTHDLIATKELYEYWNQYLRNI